MKALLITIGAVLIAGAAGESDVGSISISQIIVRALIAFALFGIAALCPGKEDA